MAVFSRWALTDEAKKLITRAQANKSTIHFTRARTGDGVWTSGENLRSAEGLKNVKQEFDFTSVDIPDGNPSTIVLTVTINNLELTELYFLNEMGIYAEDSSGGEILYAVAVSDTQAVYVPANNGAGISTITERINVEVADSANVTIETSGAVVSAADFLAVRTKLETLREMLAGGTDGQHLIKDGDRDYQMEWISFEPVITDSVTKFPKTGQKDAVYIDSDSAEIYIWKEEDGAYFKLPLGAEASQTLQKQITDNKNSIAGLTKRADTLEQATFAETEKEVTADQWVVTMESGVEVYTAEIEVTGVTEDSDIIVWPGALSADAAEAKTEMKAQATFFSKGRAYADTGKIVLKCLSGAPVTTLRIRLQGVSE